MHHDDIASAVSLAVERDLANRDTRRISLHRPTPDEVALVESKIAELEAKDPRGPEDEKKLHELRTLP